MCDRDDRIDEAVCQALLDDGRGGPRGATAEAVDAKRTLRTLSSRACGAATARLRSNHDFTHSSATHSEDHLASRAARYHRDGRLSPRAMRL